MVEECCKFVNQTPDIETKLKFIDTLRTVTEGKVGGLYTLQQWYPNHYHLLSLTQIYVEVPRARLTMELAKIKESREEIAEAANVLQELQVFICLFQCK